MKIFVCSGAFSKAATVADVIYFSQKLKIKNIELSSGLRCDLESEKLLLDSKDSNFLIHNYFPAPDVPFVLNLAAENIEDLKQSLEHCRRAIELCARIGSPIFSVHSGFAVSVHPSDLGSPDRWRARMRESEVDMTAARTRFIESVRQIADYGATLGVDILVENNVVAPEVVEAGYEHGLLNSEGEEIAEFFSALDRQNVGLLVDVGHVKVTSSSIKFQPEIFMETVKPFIRGVHLSDNDGRSDSNGKFSDDAWFWRHIIGNETIEFVVIEAYRLSSEEILSQIEITEAWFKNAD